MTEVSTGDGNDTITASGRTHDVTYLSGDVNDVLNGNRRRDILDGGAGDDRLTGGGGPDIFVIGIHGGHDTLVDFGLSGRDKIDVRPFGFTSLGELLSASTLSNRDADSDGQEDDALLEFAGVSLEILGTLFDELAENDFLFAEAVPS